MSQEGGYEKTSTAPEIENSRLKRASYGTKPYLPLDSSQNAVQNVETRGINQLERLAARGLSQSTTADGDNTYESELQKLNNRARQGLLKEFSKKTNYLCCQVIEDNLDSSAKNNLEKHYYVRSTKPRPKYEPCDTRPGCHVLPRLWRTRKVSIKDGIAVCSCNLYKMAGYACRHIYAVTSIEPRKFHCRPSHHLNYEVFYAMNVEFTEKVNEMIAASAAGVFVGIEL